MKLNRIITLLLVICVGIGCFSGCERANDIFDDNKTVEGKYNLTIACQDEDGEKEILKILKSAYEKENPDVNIVIKDFGGDMLTGYMARYASNQERLPDMIWMPDDLFAAFAKGGHFVDLRHLYEQDAITDYSLYYETMLHAASYSGEFRPTTSYNGEYVAKTAPTDKSDDEQYGLYFAPRDYNKIAIVYNTKLFKQFKIPVPDTSKGWTMNDLIQLTQTIANAIKLKGSSFAGYRALNLFLQWEPVYTTVFKAMGGESLVSDNVFNVGSAKNREICDTLYNELFSQKETIDRSGGFINGTTFMDVVVRPVAYTYSRTLKDNEGNSLVDFLPFPAEDIGAGCSGYGILKIHANETLEANGVTKTKKELAWDFIKYVISEKGQQESGRAGFTQPILKSLEENGTWREAISPTLNHSAWVAGNELRLTTFNSFEPSKRTILRNNVTAFFQNLSDTTEGAPEKRNALIQKYVDEFANNLSK